jgi:hypothetical protein
MKKLLLLVMVFNGIVYLQAQENSSSELYLGLSAGVAPQTMGFTNYLFEWGGQVLYTKNDQYLRLSYNRIDAFYLQWNDNDKIDGSRIHRIEAVYGLTTCIKDNHKLLSHIYIGVLLGLTYNDIEFYKDDIAFLFDRNVSRTTRMGIPFGITVTNRFGSWIYGGWECKCHIMYKEAPFAEVRYFIMIKI